MPAHRHLLSQERLSERIIERATENLPYVVAVKNIAPRGRSVEDSIPLLQDLMRLDGA